MIKISALLALVATHVLSLSATVLPATADADSPAIWEVQPAVVDGAPRTDFSVGLDPGARTTDAVQISNLGNREITLDLSAMDMIKTPAGEPTLPVDPSETEPIAAAWVTLSDDTLTLAPGESTDVPFTVSVPVNAEPGDYGLAVVASMSQPTTTDDGQQVLIDARVGARVYLRVLGDLHSQITVTDITLERMAPWWNPFGAQTQVDFVIENTGNVRLDASAAVAISGLGGLDLGTAQARDLPQLLPGDKLRISEIGDGEGGESGPMLISGVPAAFALEATVDIAAVETSTGQAFTYSQSATATEIPWLLVLIIALVWAWLVTSWAKRRRRRRAALAAQTSGPNASKEREEHNREKLGAAVGEDNP